MLSMHELPSQFQQILKKLNKRDLVTRTRGLEELSDWISTKADKETFSAISLQFIKVYSSCSTDVERTIRERVQQALLATIQREKKWLLPIFRKILFYWIGARDDPVAAVANLARTSFDLAFTRERWPALCGLAWESVWEKSAAVISQHPLGKLEANPDKEVVAAQSLEISYALASVSFMVEHHKDPKNLDAGQLEDFRGPGLVPKKPPALGPIFALQAQVSPKAPLQIRFALYGLAKALWREGLSPPGETDSHLFGLACHDLGSPIADKALEFLSVRGINGAEEAKVLFESLREALPTGVPKPVLPRLLTLFVEQGLLDQALSTMAQVIFNLRGFDESRTRGLLQLYCQLVDKLPQDDQKQEYLLSQAVYNESHPIHPICHVLFELIDPQILESYLCRQIDTISEKGALFSNLFKALLRTSAPLTDNAIAAFLQAFLRFPPDRQSQLVSMIGAEHKSPLAEALLEHFARENLHRPGSRLAILDIFGSRPVKWLPEVLKKLPLEAELEWLIDIQQKAGFFPETDRLDALYGSAVARKDERYAPLIAEILKKSEYRGFFGALQDEHVRRAPEWISKLPPTDIQVACFAGTLLRSSAAPAAKALLGRLMGREGLVDELVRQLADTELLDCLESFPSLWEPVIDRFAADLERIRQRPQPRVQRRGGTDGGVGVDTTTRLLAKALACSLNQKVLRFIDPAIDLATLFVGAERHELVEAVGDTLAPSITQYLTAPSDGFVLAQKCLTDADQYCALARRIIYIPAAVTNTTECLFRFLQRVLNRPNSFFDEIIVNKLISLDEKLGLQAVSQVLDNLEKLPAQDSADAPQGGPEPSGTPTCDEASGGRPPEPARSDPYLREGATPPASSTNPSPLSGGGYIRCPEKGSLVLCRSLHTVPINRTDILHQIVDPLFATLSEDAEFKRFLSFNIANEHVTTEFWIPYGEHLGRLAKLSANDVYAIELGTGMYNRVNLRPYLWPDYAYSCWTALCQASSAEKSPKTLDLERKLLCQAAEAAGEELVKIVEIDQIVALLCGATDLRVKLCCRLLFLRSLDLFLEGVRISQEKEDIFPWEGAIACLSPSSLLVDFFLAVEMFLALAEGSREVAITSSAYASLFKERYADIVLGRLVETLGWLEPDPVDLSQVEFSVVDVEPSCFNEPVLFAAHLLFRCMKCFPAVIQYWWKNRVGNRQHSSSVERYTKEFLSPLLIDRELTKIKQTVITDRVGSQLTLCVEKTSTTCLVQVSYKMEDFSMQISLNVPSSYPLTPVTVKGGDRLGISESKWRSWLLTTQTLLTTQNMPMLDAILLWRQNADKAFAGVESCSICYCILHPGDRTLPGPACKTCKHKFHSACLYKWFKTGGQATCPMCRSLF